MNHCKNSRDIQVIQVNYSNYNDMTIKDVCINIDRDRYKTLKLVDKIVVENEITTVEKVLEYSVIDESMSFEMTHEMSQGDISALIKALQQLYRQAEIANHTNNKQ